MPNPPAIGETEQVRELLAKVARFKELDRTRLEGPLEPEAQREWLELKAEIGHELFGTDPPAPDVEQEPITLRLSNASGVSSHMEATFPDVAGFQRAYLRNVSEGGVYVETTRLLDVGTRFRLRVRVEQIDQTLNLPVEVVWTNRAPSDESGLRPGVGVAFLDLTPEQQRAIQKVVHWALDQEVASSRPPPRPR